MTTEWYSYVEQIYSEGGQEKIHISLTRFDPAEKVVRKCVTAPTGTLKYRAQRIELFKELRHN
jgi:hypothetical protein